MERLEFGDALDGPWPPQQQHRQHHERPGEDELEAEVEARQRLLSDPQPKKHQQQHHHHRTAAAAGQQSPLLRPIKILLLGGPAVGKSQLLSRLAGGSFSRRYEPSDGVEALVLRVPVTAAAAAAAARKAPAAATTAVALESVEVELWDVASNFFECDDDLLMALLRDVDGFFFVLDITDANSLRAIDDWNLLVCQCHRHASSSSSGSSLSSLQASPLPPPLPPKILLVNKSDITLGRVVTPNALDIFVSGEGFSSWAFVVGHSSLSDFEASRPMWNKQSTPELQLHALLRLIFRQRVSLAASLPPSASSSASGSSPTSLAARTAAASASNVVPVPVSNAPKEVVSRHVVTF